MRQWKDSPVLKAGDKSPQEPFCEYVTQPTMDLQRNALDGNTLKLALLDKQVFQIVSEAGMQGT